MNKIKCDKIKQAKCERDVRDIFFLNLPMLTICCKNA